VYIYNTQYVPVCCHVPFGKSMVFVNYEYGSKDYMLARLASLYLCLVTCMQESRNDSTGENPLSLSLSFRTAR